MRGVHVWKRKHAATVVIFLCGAYDYLNVWSSSIITTSWIERLHVTRQHTWWYFFWCFCLTFFALYLFSSCHFLSWCFQDSSLKACSNGYNVHTDVNTQRERKEHSHPVSCLHAHHCTESTCTLTSCLLQSGSGLTPCSCAPAYICIFDPSLKNGRRKNADLATG